MTINENRNVITGEIAGTLASNAVASTARRDIQFDTTATVISEQTQRQRPRP